jgi:hypothetical protein
LHRIPIIFSVSHIPDNVSDKPSVNGFETSGTNKINLASLDFAHLAILSGSSTVTKDSVTGIHAADRRLGNRGLTMVAMPIDDVL